MSYELLSLSRETITRSTVKSAMEQGEVYIVHQVVNEELSIFGEVKKRTVESRITPPHEHTNWSGIRIPSIDPEDIFRAIEEREERLNKRA